MLNNFFERAKKSSHSLISLMCWFESISEEKAKLDDECIVRIRKIANSKLDRINLR